MSLPWVDNPFGFGTQTTPAKVLMLDYEAYEEEVGWRMKALQNGLALPDIGFNYMRGYASLANDIVKVQERIAVTGANFLLIDSLAMACGGDINKPESPTAFFAALRTLKLPALIIAHTAKNGGDNPKTIYGSVFFEAFARSIWEARRVQEEGDTEGVLGLFHRKANNSKKFHSMGFQMLFGEEFTKISPCNLGDTVLVGQLPISFQIRNILRHDPLSITEIAQLIDSTKTATQTTLYRLRDKGIVVKLGDKWGLRSDEQ